jgi:type IV pilus assembly protein PilA
VLKAIRKRMQDREEGFTLIELMVVVLIIAILIAIAIPTFLGARKRAQDRASQSNLRNALTAEKVYYTDNQFYGTAASMTAADIEKSLSFVAAAPTQGSREVQVALGDVSTGTAVTNGVVCLTAKSASGNTYSLKDVSAGTNAGTWYSAAAIGTCNDSQLNSTW